MLQYVPCWNNDWEGGKGSLPFVTYVGKGKAKLNSSPDNVADGFELPMPDESELTASKSLTPRDRITSSDAAATFPPREVVIATLP